MGLILDDYREFDDYNSMSDAEIAARVYANKAAPIGISLDTFLKSFEASHTREDVLTMFDKSIQDAPPLSLPEKRQAAESMFEEYAAHVRRTEAFDSSPTIEEEQEPLMREQQERADKFFPQHFSDMQVLPPTVDAEEEPLEPLSYDEWRRRQDFYPRGLLEGMIDPPERELEKLREQIITDFRNGLENPEYYKKAFVEASVKRQVEDAETRASVIEMRKSAEEVADKFFVPYGESKVTRWGTSAVGNIMSSLHNVEGLVYDIGAWNAKHSIGKTEEDVAYQKELAENARKLARAYHTASQDVDLVAIPETFGGNITQLGIGTAPLIGASIAASAVAGPVGAFSVVMAQGWDSMKNTLMDKGYDEEEASRIAALASVPYAAVEFATGGGGKYTKAGVLEKILKEGGGKTVTKRLLKTAAGEVIEELAQYGIEQSVYKEDISVDDMVEIGLSTIPIALFFEGTVGTVSSKMMKTRLVDALREDYPEASKVNLNKAADAAMYGAKPEQIKQVVEGKEITDVDVNESTEKKLEIINQGKNKLEQIRLKTIESAATKTKQERAKKAAEKGVVSQEEKKNIKAGSKTDEALNMEFFNAGSDPVAPAKANLEPTGSAGIGAVDITNLTAPDVHLVQAVLLDQTLRLLYDLSHGLKGFILNKMQAGANRLQTAFEQAKVQGLITDESTQENPVLTEKGARIGDSLNISFYKKQSRLVTGQQEASRENLRNFNTWMQDNPKASVNETIDQLYANNIINGNERDLWWDVRDILPESFFNNTIFITKEQTISSAGPHVAGNYDYNAEIDSVGEFPDVIGLYHARDPFTFIHELGHKGMFRLLSEADIDELRSIYRNGPAHQLYQEAKGVDPTILYENSFVEWFAENFHNYVINKLSDTRMENIFQRLKRKLSELWNRIRERSTKDEIALFDFFDKWLDSGAPPQSYEAFAKAQETRQTSHDFFAKYAQQGSGDKDHIPLSDQGFFQFMYDKMSYDKLLEMADTGDLEAQKELDNRISKKDPQKISKERSDKLKNAHKEERKAKLSPGELKLVKQRLFGKDSMRWLTDEEIDQYAEEVRRVGDLVEDPRFVFDSLSNDLMLSSQDKSRLINSAEGDYRAASIVLKKRYLDGGYTTKDKQVRQRLIDRDREWIKRVSKRLSEDEKRIEKQKQRKDVTNDLANIRYMAAEMEVLTGLPFYTTIESIENGATYGEHEAYGIVTNVLKRPGRITGKSMSLLDLASKKVQTPLINEALYEQDEALRKKIVSKMTPFQQDLYYKMYEILQGPSANAIRELRWWRWNRALLMAETHPDNRVRASFKKEANQLQPKGLKKDELDRILKEGRDAYEKGKLRDWISRETFGTKEYYFTSEASQATLLASILSPTELNTVVGKTPLLDETKISEIYTRNAQTKEAQRPVIQAVLTHLKKSLIANEIKENFIRLQAISYEAGLTKTDVDRLSQWSNNLIGNSSDISGTFLRIAEGVNKLFWRSFPLQIKKAAHFFVRNVLQPLYIAGHLSKEELLRAGVRVLSGKGNPFLSKAMNENWMYITQKNSMRNEFMLLREASLGHEFGAMGTFKSMGSLMLDKAGTIITVSDDIDRRIAFPVFHEAAYRNADEYKNKTHDYNRLRNRLKLDNLNEVQINQLERLLVDNDLEQFSYLFAKYKTENIFFKYSRGARSFFEQSRAGRLLSGLIVYPRGMVDQIVQNTAKPFGRGVKRGDALTIYQGLTTAAGLFIGLRLAHEISRFLMGDRDPEDYALESTVVGYTPLSIGFSKAMETWEFITNDIADTIERNGLSVETAHKIAEGVDKTMLEWWIPLVDVYVSMYENMNDTSHENFYNALLSDLNRDYERTHGKPFNTDRTMLEKFQHVVFGSYEEEKDRYKEMSDYTTPELFQRFLTGKRAER
jgi:hypothetical protein